MQFSLQLLDNSIKVTVLEYVLNHVVEETHFSVK